MRIKILLKLLVLNIGILGSFSFGQTNSQQEKVALRLCQEVKNIKELPRDWGEKGVDKTYDKIIAAGHSVVPCLIDNVTDQTIMKDPRCPTISNATTIGDISYFLIVDLLQLDFVELLPADIKEKYKTEGVYAYHEYIDRPEARSELQERLRVRYRELQASSKPR